jgi:integrase
MTLTSGTPRAVRAALACRDLERGEVLLERGVVYVTGQPLIDKATKTRSKRRLALDAGTVELLRAHRGRAEQVARELGFTLPAGGYLFSREPDGSRPIHRSPSDAPVRRPGPVARRALSPA